jgi:hypothetical protein
MNGLEFFHNLWRTKVDNTIHAAPKASYQEESSEHELFEADRTPIALADRINDDIVLTTPKGKNITVGEIRNSNRISKSSTPKHDLSWYIKWIASCFILASMTMRGKEALVDYDITLSLIGVCGWFIVGFLWNDRALILLNGAGILFFVSTILTKIVG